MQQSEQKLQRLRAEWLYKRASLDDWSFIIIIIHQHMVGKNKQNIENTYKTNLREMKLTHIKQKNTQEAHVLNSELQVRLTRLFVQLDTAGYWKLYTLASLKIYFFSYKVCRELHSQNVTYSQLRHRMIL